jgi:DNA-binding NarL/FixJ family response regulator
MKSVLIVDDHAVVRRGIGLLLTTPSHDFEVTGQAENGLEAIREAERIRPDLIILDLSMPVMNGLEAAVVLKKILPGVPLILFTSHDGPAVERLAHDVGIDSVVPESQAAHSLLSEAKRLCALP